MIANRKTRKKSLKRAFKRADRYQCIYFRTVLDIVETVIYNLWLLLIWAFDCIRSVYNFTPNISVLR